MKRAFAFLLSLSLLLSLPAASRADVEQRYGVDALLPRFLDMLADVVTDARRRRT